MTCVARIDIRINALLAIVPLVALLWRCHPEILTIPALRYVLKLPRLILPSWKTGGSIRKLAADFSDNVLNIHMIPHTHDDVGWRLTVEQYYYGLNASIETRGHVHAIISTSIEALLQNPNRVFTYVEMKFFAMWWYQQSDAVKDSVRYLIANQQLFFVNGGWCMHDEATTHFMGMIDQTTLGHDFLQRELGVVPTVGWQLDPFGHSATQASLMTSKMGFDALYFGRIDYQDLDLRRNRRQCEGLWNASNHFDSTIFWGLTGQYGGNYGAPPGFCFDIGCKDESLLDIDEARLLQRVKDFLSELSAPASQTLGNHLMVTMGGDFNQMAAQQNYANLDVLIGAAMDFQQQGMLDIPIFFNDYRRVNLFYSTPEYYTQCKSKEMQRSFISFNADDAKSMQWEVKRDDFFPYSDCDHCFWTGYFTSRTAFKRFERAASSFVMAARQIRALLDSADSEDPMLVPLYALEDALGVVQHHDAVSGTAKQHVADDYSSRLHSGFSDAARYLASVLKRQMFGVNENIQLYFCPLANETLCTATEQATKSDQSTFYAVIYNALTLDRFSIVRLPVASTDSYSIARIDGNATPFTVIAMTGWSGKPVVAFDTGTLAPLTAVVYKITRVGRSSENQMSFPSIDKLADVERRDEPASSLLLLYSNGILTVEFDKSTGLIHSIQVGDSMLNVSQVWGYYPSYDDHLDRNGEFSRQNSGAYIFRPQSSCAELVQLDADENAQFLNTSVGLEVRASFGGGWVKQTARLLPGRSYVELEYMVGPVPIDDGRGKEVVLRWISASIDNKGVFYTDSNGREFMRRERNFRPTWNMSVHEPIAGNYYPVNTAIYIEDANAALAIAVDRSQGGGSVNDGQLELMVQRRTLADDHRGVDEAINETVGGMTPYPPFGNAQRLGEGVVVQGTLRVLVGPGRHGASLARSAMDDMFAPPVIFIGTTKDNEPVDVAHGSVSGFTGSLPPNVMIITLQKIANNDWRHGSSITAIRLRLGHQYGHGEHETLSEPAEVNIATIFHHYAVLDVQEMTLSGNRRLDEATRAKLKWVHATNEVHRPKLRSSSNSTIILQPMEIKTFVVKVRPIDSTWQESKI